MYEELKTSSESLDAIYEEFLKLKGKNVDEAQDAKTAENKSKIESNLQDINALAKWVEDSEKSANASRALSAGAIILSALAFIGTVLLAFTVQ